MLPLLAIFLVPATASANDIPLNYDLQVYLILGLRTTRISTTKIEPGPGCNIGVNCTPSVAVRGSCGYLHGKSAVIPAPGQVAANQVCGTQSFFQVFSNVTCSDPSCAMIGHAGAKPDCTDTFDGPIIGDLDGDNVPSCDGACVSDADDVAAACGTVLPLPACDPLTPVRVDRGQDCSVGDVIPGNGRCDLAAGTYGSIRVMKGGRIDFAPGTTVICSMSTQAAVRITKQTGGPARILVPGTGMVKINNSADVGGDCGDMSIVTERGTIKLGRYGDYTLDACSIAGQMRLGHGNNLKGHYIADLITSDKDNDGRCTCNAGSPVPTTSTTVTVPTTSSTTSSTTASTSPTTTSTTATTSPTASSTSTTVTTTSSTSDTSLVATSSTSSTTASSTTAPTTSSTTTSTTTLATTSSTTVSTTSSTTATTAATPTTVTTTTATSTTDPNATTSSSTTATTTSSTTATTSSTTATTTATTATTTATTATTTATTATTPSTTASTTSSTSTTTPTTATTSSSTSTSTTTSSSTTTTIPIPGNFTRTPGFYKNHPDITQSILSHAGGLVVCGRPLTDVDVNHGHSALEALCIAVKGDQRSQLLRHLVTAALNMSAGGKNYPGYAACNAICANAGSTSAQLTSCIDQTDFYNQSGDDVMAPWDPPGPANPGPCQAAFDTPCTVLSPGPCAAP